MSELPPKKIPFGMPRVQKIPGMNEKAKIDRFREFKIQFLLPLLGWKYIGEGSQSIVLMRKRTPEMVIAYTSYLDRTKADAIFHAHRILTSLFPQNFPKIHSAFPETTTSLGGTVRQYIDSSAPDDSVPYEEIERKYPFQKVRDTIRLLGLDEYSLFDQGSDKNFITNEKGEEYYVDTVNIPGISDLVRAKEKILTYMHENQELYSEKDIEGVAQSLGFLEELISKKRSVF